MIRSYGKIYNLGHRALDNLLKDHVIVQEKLDGSQFSFMKRTDGVVIFRSKGAEIHPGSGNKLFEPAMAQVLIVADRLRYGCTYRAEAVTRPRHNTLHYSRVPKNFIYLYDMDLGMEHYADYNAVVNEANKLEVEPPSTIWTGAGVDLNMDMFEGWLKLTSILGGPTLEGIVIKNYTRFGIDGRALMGKYVSETFKEIHGKAWKNRHPGDGAVKERLVATYKTDARWEKAVQHARDAGELLGEPRDIPHLIRAINQDIIEECKEEILEVLWKWAWKDISRGCVKGFAEWYKKALAAEQFSSPLPADCVAGNQPEIADPLAQGMSITNGQEVKPDNADDPA